MSVVLEYIAYVAIVGLAIKWWGALQIYLVCRKARRESNHLVGELMRGMGLSILEDIHSPKVLVPQLILTVVICSFMAGTAPAWALLIASAVDLCVTHYFGKALATKL